MDLEEGPTPVTVDPRFVPAPWDTLPPPKFVFELPTFSTEALTALQQGALDRDPAQRLVAFFNPVQPNGQRLQPPVRPEPPAARRRDLLLRQRREGPGKWDSNREDQLTDWVALLANGQWLLGYDL